MGSILEPFLLSLVAGLATGIGGLIVIALRKVSDRFVSFSLGFASGVMLMVAFNDLFLEAQKLLIHVELIAMWRSHDDRLGPYHTSYRTNSEKRKWQE
jgi:zinc transporter ZupT